MFIVPIDDVDLGLDVSGSGPTLDVCGSALGVVLEVTASFVSAVADRLQQELQGSLLSVRQVLAAPRRSGGESPAPQLSDLANGLLSGVVDAIKAALTGLKRLVMISCFTASVDLVSLGLPITNNLQH